MTGPPDQQRDRIGALNPAALPVAEMARLLTRVGGQPTTAAMIERDIDEGAPTNGDGTLNLVHYAAWVVRNLSQGMTGGGDRRGD
ncbi:MAG: hypothetical protein IT430_15945 [Phycisphaerales bacterium]|nr:hypothetical protein [Phycisphaerales bacterium]